MRGSVHHTMNASAPSATTDSRMKIQRPDSNIYTYINVLARMIRHLLLVSLLALLAACAGTPATQTAAAACPASQSCPVCPVCPAPPVPPPRVSVLEPVSYDDLPGWREDTLDGVMGALRASCRALRFQTAWREACAAAGPIGPENAEALRRYLETNFVPHRVANPDGATQGLITGYYEPLLRGSRERRGPYRFPL